MRNAIFTGIEKDALKKCVCDAIDSYFDAKRTGAQWLFESFSDTDFVNDDPDDSDYETDDKTLWHVRVNTHRMLTGRIIRQVFDGVDVDNINLVGFFGLVKEIFAQCRKSISASCPIGISPNDFCKASDKLSVYRRKFDDFLRQLKELGLVNIFGRRYYLPDETPTTRDDASKWFDEYSASKLTSNI